LPTGDVERLRTRYDTILTEAEAEAGNPPRPCSPGTRGRVKQSPAYNLIRQAESLRLFPLRYRRGAFAIIRSYLATRRK